MHLDIQKIQKNIGVQRTRGDRERGEQPLLTLECFLAKYKFLRTSETEETCKGCLHYEKTCRINLEPYLVPKIIHKPDVS